MKLCTPLQPVHGAKHPEITHLIPRLLLFPVSAIRIMNSPLFTTGMNWTPLQWDVLKTQRLILITGLPQILQFYHDQYSRNIFCYRYPEPVPEPAMKLRLPQSVNAGPASNWIICPGSSTVLAAGGASSSYSWSTGETTSFISATPSGLTWYTVTGTDEFGCVTY